MRKNVTTLAAYKSNDTLYHFSNKICNQSMTIVIIKQVVRYDMLHHHHQQYQSGSVDESCRSSIPSSFFYRPNNDRMPNKEKKGYLFWM
jgi:hypothetical protein